MTSSGQIAAQPFFSPFSLSNVHRFDIKYVRINTQTQSDTDNGVLETFRLEFLDCWKQVPSKAFFFTVLIAWLALFHFFGNSTFGYVSSRSLMHWMFRAYNPYPGPALPGEEQHTPESPDAHGNLVPFVVMGLFWWKRKELLSTSFRTWWPGLLLLGTGLLFHLLGFAVQQPRLSVLGLFTGLYGLMGLAWGPDWLRRSFFPFCLFAFAMPLGSLAEPLTFRLRLLVSVLVEGISHHIFQIDVLRQGTKLIDPSGRYEYEVAAACSGIRSLVATVALALVLGVLSFRSWWKRLVMLSAALPLAVLGNLVRMLLIVIFADWKGREWGLWVHDGGPGGVFVLLIYVPAFLGLIALERYLYKISPEPEPVMANGNARIDSVNVTEIAASSR